MEPMKKLGNVVLYSQNRKDVYLWPPGSQRPIRVPKSAVTVSEASVVTLSHSAVARGIALGEQRHRDAPLYGSAFYRALSGTPLSTLWRQQDRTYMNIMSAVGVFGASTACGAFFQVLTYKDRNPESADDNQAAGSALGTSFNYFIFGTILTFAPPSLLELAGPLVSFCYCAIAIALLAIGTGCLIKSMVPYFGPKIMQEVWAWTAGSIIVFPSLYVAVRVCAAGILAISAVITARLHTGMGQKPEDMRLPPTPCGRMLFLSTYDSYGGMIANLLEIVTDYEALSTEEQAQRFVAAIESVFPSFLSQGTTEWDREKKAYSERVVHGIRLWYTAAEHLRVRHFDHYGHMPMSDRVACLKHAEMLLKGHTDELPGDFNDYSVEGSEISRNQTARRTAVGSHAVQIMGILERIKRIFALMGGWVHRLYLAFIKKPRRSDTILFQSAENGTGTTLQQGHPNGAESHLISEARSDGVSENQATASHVDMM